MDYKEIDRIVDQKDIYNREIYEAFKPLVIRSIKQYCFNGQDMDELINEGLEEITYAILDYDKERKVTFTAYLKATLRFFYLGKNRDKKHLSLNIKSPTADSNEEYIDLLKADCDLTKYIERRAEVRRLYENVRKLPPRQQDVVYKYYLEEKDSDNVCQELGISKPAFYRSKGAGIDKLRKYYKGEDGHEIISKFVN